MSFSAEVKKELAAVEPHGECCITAQAYGLLLFGRSFTQQNISLLTDHRCVGEAYRDAIAEVVGATPRFVESEAGKFLVSAATNAGRRKILNFFSADEGAMGLRINHANLLNESGDEFNCCYAAFLRGAFLSCGTVTDPNKNYHLEFDVTRKKLCDDLKKIMSESGISAKISVRRGSYVVYIKDSGSIEDILTFMGATSSSMELMGIKMYKDVRNRANRKTNFDTANITRTASAAAKQIEAIETIQKYMGIENLIPGLRELAAMRIEDFDKSLAELGAALNPPISRSGVNHRLQRLITIADELKKEHEEVPSPAKTQEKG